MGAIVVEWFIVLKLKDLSKLELGVKVQNMQIGALMFEVSDQPFQELQKSFIKQLTAQECSLCCLTLLRGSWLRGTLKQSCNLRSFTLCPPTETRRHRGFDFATAA